MIPIVDTSCIRPRSIKNALSGSRYRAPRLLRHAQARMRWLDSELAKRPFITGDQYTIAADITAQCALILGKNTGTPIPNDSQHLAQ